MAGDLLDREDTGVEHVGQGRGREEKWSPQLPRGGSCPEFRFNYSRTGSTI